MPPNVGAVRHNHSALLLSINSRLSLLSSPSSFTIYTFGRAKGKQNRNDTDDADETNREHTTSVHCSELCNCVTVCFSGFSGLYHFYRVCLPADLVIVEVLTDLDDVDQSKKRYRMTCTAGDKVLTGESVHGSS